MPLLLPRCVDPCGAHQATGASLALLLYTVQVPVFGVQGTPQCVYEGLSHPQESARLLQARPMSGATGLALLIILAVGFVGLCYSLWVDACERDDDERERQLRREIRRKQHPTEWTDDDESC